MGTLGRRSEIEPADFHPDPALAGLQEGHLQAAFQGWEWEQEGVPSGAWGWSRASPQTAPLPCGCSLLSILRVGGGQRPLLSPALFLAAPGRSLLAPARPQRFLTPSGVVSSGSKYRTVSFSHALETNFK